MDDPATSRVPKRWRQPSPKAGQAFHHAERCHAIEVLLVAAPTPPPCVECGGQVEVTTYQYLTASRNEWTDRGQDEVRHPYVGVLRQSDVTDVDQAEARPVEIPRWAMNADYHSLRSKDVGLASEHETARMIWSSLAAVDNQYEVGI